MKIFGGTPAPVLKRLNNSLDVLPAVAQPLKGGDGAAADFFVIDFWVFAFNNRLYLFALVDLNIVEHFVDDFALNALAAQLHRRAALGHMLCKYQCLRAPFGIVPVVHKTELLHALNRFLCGLSVAGAADFVAQLLFGMTAVGDEPGFITGIDMVYMHCDSEISNIISECAKDMGLNTVRGTIATGDIFVAEDSVRNRIAQLFNGVAAEMEGGAIGHVCVMNDVPFAILRAMSDCANDDSKIDFPTFAVKAAANSIEIISGFLNRYKG